MNKYLEYFLSLNVLTKEKKHTSALNRARMYADFPNSDRNSPQGRNAAWNWKVIIFSNKVEIPGSSFGCFPLFYSLVISSLCPPWSPPLPQGIQMEKLSFKGICTKKAFGSRDFFQKHLSVLGSFPRTRLNVLRKDSCSKPCALTGLWVGAVIAHSGPCARVYLGRFVWVSASIYAKEIMLHISCQGEESLNGFIMEFSFTLSFLPSL